MSGPQLSVVMPLLNQAAFLEASVRSVMAQPLDLELVVMDGGSSDGSLQMLARLAAEFVGRLRWFSAPDSGPAQALNRAVAQARAPLLGWLPADDLYTAGAAARAVEALQSRPDWDLVYGEGEHIDVTGRPLGRYPTLLPDTPYERFAEGCFVCQPTLFMRRCCWLEAGGVDESLRAAFDFELWLRLFRRHAGRIGFIDQVQAQSRLHAGGITLRERERVALEGMQVLHRHLGSAPPEWLLTHFEERLAQHPFAIQEEDLMRVFSRLAQLAEGWTDEAGRLRLRDWLGQHAALRFCSPLVGIDCQPDGWLGPQTALRLRGNSGGGSLLELELEHAHPHNLPLTLNVLGPQGWVCSHQQASNGRFSLLIPLPKWLAGERASWTLQAEPAFVPADLEPGSADRRRLALRLCELRLR